MDELVSAWVLPPADGTSRSCGGPDGIRLVATMERPSGEYFPGSPSATRIASPPSSGRTQAPSVPADGEPSRNRIDRPSGEMSATNVEPSHEKSRGASTPRREEAGVLGARDEKAPVLSDVLQIEEVGKGMDQPDPPPPVDAPERGGVDVRPARGVPDLARARAPAQTDATFEHPREGASLRPVHRDNPNFSRVVGSGRVVDERDLLLVRGDRDVGHRPGGAEERALDLSCRIADLKRARRALVLDDGGEAPLFAQSAQPAF